MRRYIRYNNTGKRALLAPAIVLGLISGLGALSLVYCIRSERKEKEVDKQVEAYEKTLPGYLEQKHQVEHYRDSLMNAKTKRQ